MERQAHIEKKTLQEGKRIFAAAAVVTAVCMTTNTVVPFMTYAYADTANIRAGQLLLQVKASFVRHCRRAAV